MAQLIIEPATLNENLPHARERRANSSIARVFAYDYCEDSLSEAYPDERWRIESFIFRVMSDNCIILETPSVDIFNYVMKPILKYIREGRRVEDLEFAYEVNEDSQVTVQFISEGRVLDIDINSLKVPTV